MAETSKRVHIRPNHGFQEPFLSTRADIAIGGGHAGSGKTRALLHEAIRHAGNPSFRAVIFRRKTTEITAGGGLWDEACNFYIPLGAKARGGSILDMTWPSGSTLQFRHMQHETDRFSWQGSQMPLIMFDELTHFTYRQFSYLAFSRGRQMSGDGPKVKRYVRATCNPDADSWVAHMLSWWIDQTTGIAIPERSGVLRWFVRKNDEFVWADSPDELTARHPDLIPQSMTFVVGSLEDNPYSDTPQYRSGLQALDHVERERLLGGNWKIRELPTGLVFHELNQRTMAYTDADLPEKAREALPLFGGMDFGTAAFKTLIAGGLVELVPQWVLWIDAEVNLPQADFGFFLDTWEETLRGYGGWKWIYGDPAGRQTHKDNRSWVQDITARGMIFAKIGDVFAPRASHVRDVYGEDVKDRALVINSKPWKRVAIRIVNQMLKDGRIRIHERCSEMWRGLLNWRYDLPEGLTEDQLEDVNREDVDVRHDRHSDKGMVLLYLCLGVDAWIRAQRAENRQGEVYEPEHAGTFMEPLSPSVYGNL